MSNKSNKIYVLMFILLLLVIPMCFAQEDENVVSTDLIDNALENSETNDYTGVNTKTSQKVEIVYFGSAGCPHCAALSEFLDGLQERNPDLVIKRYELKDNIQLFFEYADKYGLEVGDSISVPVTFTHEKVLVGFNNNIAKEIETCVNECIVGTENNDNIIQTIGQGTQIQPKNDLNKLTISAVVVAAVVDAINPCAFAVLIILLTTILANGIKRKALYAGLAFTLSIFIAYFLMGIGLFNAIRAADLTRWFYIIVACLAIIIGLFNLKDYLWYGKWFIMEVPLSWRPHMKAVLRGVTSVPGAFMIGFVVSLFLLPCTSGPYIVILGLLAQAATKNYAMWLLVLYNLIFILPMLIITLAIYFGFTTTEKAEEWRTKKLKVLHLIAGIIILVLGISMFIAMWLGYI